jgi:two-component system response regulator AtoC
LCPIGTTLAPVSHEPAVKMWLLWHHRCVTRPPSPDSAATTPATGRGDPAPPLRRSLLVMRGDGVVVHALPRTGEVTIGRGAGCDVLIDDPSISRSHLVLSLNEDRILVTDQGGVNGTSLRGVRVPGEVPVAVSANEAITAGDVVLVVQEVRAMRAPMPGPVRPSGPLNASGTVPIVMEPAMKRLYELAARIARGAIGILLIGETGAGKEVLAEFVHRSSPRAAKPLVRVNCAALTDSLIESELFGHEKGAFTGADRERRGLIEAADGGTVFLDEIGEISAAVQAKLLRVLEERRILRVGASAPRPIDVRFIAATNRDLEAEVAAGRFRQDLYFRLAGAVLAIPPLRDRPSEIEVLARGFTEEIAARLELPQPRLGDDVIGALRRHAWPGNVRELRNVIERAILVASGPALQISDLPFDGNATAASRPPGPTASRPAPAPADASLPDELAAIERQRIIDALARCDGNQTRAAELLGLPRRTFIKRLEEYDLPRPRKR